jgi:hypothetical protein
VTAGASGATAAARTALAAGAREQPAGGAVTGCAAGSAVTARAAGGAVSAVSAGSGEAGALEGHAVAAKTARTALTSRVGIAARAAHATGTAAAAVARQQAAMTCVSASAAGPAGTAAGTRGAEPSGTASTACEGDRGTGTTAQERGLSAVTTAAAGSARCPARGPGATVAAGGESCCGIGISGDLSGAAIAAMPAGSAGPGHSPVTTGATVGMKLGSHAASERGDTALTPTSTLTTGNARTAGSAGTPWCPADSRKVLIRLCEVR